MSVPRGSIFGRLTGRLPTFDAQGQRLIAYSLESGRPIFAPKGHGMLLSAAGGGKTTRGAMVWLFSLLSTAGSAATLVLDSKNGEMSVQVAPLLAELGIPFAIIDDMDVWGPLAPRRVTLNPFGSAVATWQRDKRDLVYTMDSITLSLIPEPKDDAKNEYFRAWPRKLIGFALDVLLKRDCTTATPGGVATILGDPEMLQTHARIEADEGEGAVRTAAQEILDMLGHEHWPQHVEQAQRAVRLFGSGTRLSEAGRDATTTHEDLIRQGAVIFLVGPIRQAEPLGQREADHSLEAHQHRVLADRAARDQPVAVLPVGIAKDLVDLSCFPERDVAERRQPFLHVPNVFKNHHTPILPKNGPRQQLSGDIP